MESSRRLVILLVAGVIVAFAAIAIRNRVSTNDAPVEQVTMVAISKRDIALGTLIQATDLMWSPPLPTTPIEGMITTNDGAIESYNGAVVRRQIKAGEPVPQNALMRSSEGGFMSAVLEPGMRAVSVAVNATSGNAGFISPGDRVDLIVTHRIKRANGAGGDGGGGSTESVVSETFVHDVRVLAVDQMLDNPENKAILAKTVTVEVNNQQAEQVSVASEMGKISMSLRSLTDAPAGGPQGLEQVYGRRTSDSDVSGALEVGGAMPRMKVIRGDQVENLEFTR